MLTQGEANQARERTVAMLQNAGVALTPDEAAQVEVADFGLGDLLRYGLQLVTYINTERVCAKELVLFPRQTCPEHRHPPVGSDPGKEETFRCRSGVVYVYLPGEPTPDPQAQIHGERQPYFTVFHEHILHPGEQVTIPPDTLHWFQAGDSGAVVSEFSTRSRDESDIFTDPGVVRAPQIAL
ncbi:MAG: D-lyxose/D-mannose family sugar isomerase [Armatimonadaceae bacterium]